MREKCIKYREMVANSQPFQFSIQYVRRLIELLLCRYIRLHRVERPHGPDQPTYPYDQTRWRRNVVHFYPEPILDDVPLKRVEKRA